MRQGNSRGSVEWLRRRFSRGTTRERRLLAETISVAQRLERAARFRLESRDDVLRFVAYASLVRGVELGQGVLDLRGNPVEHILLRSLLELYVNLHFIWCDRERARQLAEDFHDFAEVSRLLFMAEAGERFPHLAEIADPAALREELRQHEERFRHMRCEHRSSARWDWCKLTLVDRLNRLAKQLERAGAPREATTRLLVVYSDTNGYVHSGMLSLIRSVIVGLGQEVAPRGAVERANISMGFLAALLLRDVMALVTQIGDISICDADIARLDARGKRLLALAMEGEDGT